MRHWLVALYGFVAACGSPDETTTVPLGEIIGRVEIDQDVPQPGCRILVEGTPRSANCDQVGQFSLRAIDPGKWELRIIADASESIPSRRITTAANPGFITDLGAIRIARPGRVGGRVSVPPGTSLPFAVITVPGFNVATSPDPMNRGYLLNNVPAGFHDVVLTTERGDMSVEHVMVRPDGTTPGVDFDLTKLVAHELEIAGTAIVAGSDDKSGISVDLVETVNGSVTSTVVTNDEGAFTVTASSGVYMLRAHRSDRPYSATLPSVVVHGQNNILLNSALVIPEAGDLDGDGIPDATDTDRDGDNTDDSVDAFPNDPAEAGDMDGDGVGDNSDIDKDGNGNVDKAVMTPDMDNDGFLDFEDVCPNRANADQLDGDHDGKGNLCDNCPGVANADQLDSDMNGTGDVCEACIGGAPCQPANACNVGVLRCTGGGPVCDDTLLPKPDGSACGAGQVCFAGACAPCSNGGSCYTSTGGSCVVGVQSCATGQEVCLPTAAKLPDGTMCGPNQVCDNGVCSACTSGGACTYAPNECHAGRLSCSAGLPQICEDSGFNAADGTPCNGNQFCLAGTCMPCNQGGACSPAAAPCHVGAYSCGTGTAVCMDQGSNVPDGTACQGAGMYCVSGACITSPNVLSVTSGGNQTASVGAFLTPVVVKLANGGGAPIVGEDITVQAPPGALVSAPPGMTDSNGQTSFTLRLGPTPGTQTFTVLSDQAPPLSLPMTATSTPAGQIHTIVNIAHTAGNQGIPGPAINARTNGPTHMVFGPDGTMYYADYSTHQVLAIDPGGNIRVFAGGGTNAPPYGDNGPADNAWIQNPIDLALAGNYLYIADFGLHRIRRVNLTTNVITTFAGGQTVGGPTYGDGGPANAADIYLPTGVAVAPNGEVYFIDYGHTRIRKVDTNGTITTVAIADYCVANPTAGLYGFAAESDLAFDAGGALFISATVCGVSGTADYGILRRDTDGTFAHIAGNSQGTNGDGTEGRNTSLLQTAGITFDAGGNLYVVEYAGQRIRRIDANTGIVSTVAGNGMQGSAGEYAVATSSPMYYPRGAVFSGNDLYVSDSNNSIRRVAGVGSSSSTPITMTQVAATGSAVITDLFPAFTAKLSNGGTSYSGLRVTWSSPDVGAALLSSSTLTDPTGLASVSLRAGFAPGPYRVVGTFETIHGVDIPGSPATFTLTATAPAAGTIFTAVNIALGGQVEVGVPGPGTQAHIASPYGFAVSSTGLVYFADSQRIRTISPLGIVTTIAGSGAANPIGDGPALGAGFSTPYGLALDETNNKLYIADYGHSRIRVLDLTTSTVSTFAGGATGLFSPWGDGGPATSAELSGVTRIALGPDNALYLTDIGHNRVRRIDLAPPNIITTFLMPSGTCAIGTPGLASCAGTDCDLVWRGTALYMTGTVCNGNFTQLAYGVTRRNMDTTFTHFAGQHDGSTADGPAASAYITDPATFTVMQNGDIALVDQYRIRKIAGGNITTIANQANMIGHTGDYGPATSASVYYPYGIVELPGGHLMFGEPSNYCVRVIY